MSTDPSQVIFLTGATASTTLAYHHDFPEIRADGESPRDAAFQLSNQLLRALDSALTDWRRQSLEQAIADVRAFAERDA